jgi:tetratricopeptide (TPR) repeat protein
MKMKITPVCFMVMPFGTKPTGMEAGKGPAQIDFNALWERALRPMIEELGYLPVRADQDLGALIIQEMIERLAIADLVIAELTIPNGNVYYELGVRHAARKQGCIIVAADGSKQLFDTGQMRRVTYPLSEGTVSEEAAKQIQLALKEEVRKRLDAVSPVFQILPGYPNQINLANVGSFRDTAERLAAFQAEVSAARRLPREQFQAETMRLLTTYRAEAMALPTIALELLSLLRDAREWQTALTFTDELPERTKTLPTARELRALFLSKLDKHQDAIVMLEGLIATEGDSSERRGLLGGRYKALYDASQDSEARRQFLNQAILQYERGMQSDLNDYYPSSNLPRLYRERGEKGDEKRATSSAGVAMLACDRSRARNPQDPWALLTLLGAALDAGDLTSARKSLDEIKRAGTTAFPVSATLPDLRRSLGLLKDAKKSLALAGIVKEAQQMIDPKGLVAAVAGRRIDAPEAGTSRFPASNEPAVTQRVRNMLVATAATTLVCSAACGTDIIALEVAGELGLRRRIILPFRPALFRETSVVDRGAGWGGRFDKIIEVVDASAGVVESAYAQDDPNAYEATNKVILDTALQEASAAGLRTIAIAVWDGASRGAGDVTKAFLEEAQRGKLETITVLSATSS